MAKRKVSIETLYKGRKAEAEAFKQLIEFANNSGGPKLSKLIKILTKANERVHDIYVEMIISKNEEIIRLNEETINRATSDMLNMMEMVSKETH